MTNFPQTNGTFFSSWLSDMKLFNLFLFCLACTLHRDLSSSKVIANLKLISQSAFCIQVMFTNDPCAQFWPQNLGNFDGLAKLGHFGHFGYFGHQREFLWPLGQRPFCLAQILYLIKYILPDEYYKGQVSWFLTERWHAIRSSRKSSWKLSS